MQFIELFFKKNRDFSSKRVKKQLKDELSLELNVKVSKRFIFDFNLSDKELKQIESIIIDPILQYSYLNPFYKRDVYNSNIIISKYSGVTDDEGSSLQEIVEDLFSIKLKERKVSVQHIYYFKEKLDIDLLEAIAKRLANPLIHNFNYNVNEIPLVATKENLLDLKTELIDLNISDKKLLEISQKRVLALNLEEMLTIKRYFLNSEVINKREMKNLKELTDCELEIFAQTWSEHCKHKEFNAIINYRNDKTSENIQINSLYNTFIKGATKNIEKKLGKRSYLVKVFSDNAGVVRVNKDKLFLWKVETHNSPSAIDPYGGAITGILGNNRDAIGVGKGGSKPLFNTDVLCFGPLDYSKKLLSRQHHPKDIFSGVIEGIKDGGNKSGIPTINGSIIFDDRFSGKPLVFCGTGAIMNSKIKNSKSINIDSWTKEIDNGDLIFMAGGRVGKDGIHGATFSSVKLDKNSPTSAVQIGSPITQKKMSDFLEVVSNRGYIKAITDNGAGGLSSSVGELAEISNGAKVFIDTIPLKYQGLKPWEIFVSESQERMTLVVSPEYKEKILKIADKMDVEVTEIGFFTDSGYLEVFLQNNHIAFLDLDFLHNGVPKKRLEAEYKEPVLYEPIININMEDIKDIVIKIFSSYNVCSKESVVRTYDHEVKGKTILKPFMGEFLQSPQDAAVIRIDFNSYEGIVVSNGIMPKFGDLDAYQMSAGAFDEAIRSIISVGGKLTNLDSNSDEIFNFWSVNDNFTVPNSVFDESNPDGKEKLAKVVQMNQALYDMATFFNIPLTSGKDSMKNDFVSDGIKISIPPTILYSVTHKIDDVRKIISSDYKNEGDLIYQVNNTYYELGGSEFYKLFNELGKNVPIVRKKKALDIYKKMMKLHDENLLESSHDISDGGMIITLIESTFGTTFGIDINLNSKMFLSEKLKIDQDKDFLALLFSETHSRFIVSVKPKNKNKFEEIIKNDAFYLGKVTKDNKIKIRKDNDLIILTDKVNFLNAWNNGLSF